METKTLHERVEDALATIRPYLQGDGGDVRLHAIHDDMVVEVELLGACESCSMSQMTMKAGLEEAVKRAAPEVREVRAKKS